MKKVTEDSSLNTGKDYYSADDYRRFQIGILLRISIVICVLMLICNVVLSLSLMQIADSVRVDSVVLTRQNSSGKMVDVEPVSADMNNIDILNEVMVKKYILLRHNILSNVDVMRFRWDAGGLLQYLSSPEVYKDFYKNKDAMKLLLTTISSGTQLPVEVEFIDIKKLANNLWSVDFDTIEYDELTGISSKKHWVASMRARNDPKRISYGNYIINPLGFVVTEYNLAQKTAK